MKLILDDKTTAMMVPAIVALAAKGENVSGKVLLPLDSFAALLGDSPDAPLSVTISLEVVPDPSLLGSGSLLEVS